MFRHPFVSIKALYFSNIVKNCLSFIFSNFIAYLLLLGIPPIEKHCANTIKLLECFTFDLPGNHL
jgi:hypothetical protein